MLINIDLLIKKIYKLLFPQKCISCNKDDFWICPKCINGLKKPEAIKQDWIYTIWSYKDKRVRKIIWFLKFNNRHSILDDIKDNLNKAFIKIKKENNLSNILIIPTPITKRSLYKRGYNQSFLIAKKIKDSNSKLKNNILFKTNNHIPQNKIKNKEERMNNIINSFGLKNIDQIKNRDIVLIDDVVTTGATLSEAKKILKQNGAKSVYALTIAH